jgi:hypothetical protein
LASVAAKPDYVHAVVLCGPNGTGCAEVPDTFAELLRRFRVAASLT